MLEFTCPMDCLAGVGEVWSGQYVLPAGSRVTGTPVILDIGANCGAFTLWAKLHWPGAPITAYEPQPDIFNYLAANVGSLPGVAIHCAAVGDPARPFLHPGSDSRLCSSQYQIGEQQPAPVPVGVVHPGDLTAADIMKVDAEGAEGFIVENLKFMPHVLLLEWHGAEQRRRVELAVGDRMKLGSARMVALDRGIYCYLRE